MSNSVDRLGWMRLLWGTINIDNFAWREPKQGFQQLPMATIVTDCKSLYDLVSRTAIPSCEESRTTLEVLLIRERCLEHSQFRWIPTSLQVADALTKPMDPILLRQVLASGCFQLHDEDDSLERNAHRKQAVRWLKEQNTATHGVSSKEFRGMWFVLIQLSLMWHLFARDVFHDYMDRWTFASQSASGGLR